METGMNGGGMSHCMSVIITGAISESICSTVLISVLIAERSPGNNLTDISRNPHIPSTQPIISINTCAHAKTVIHSRKVDCRSILIGEKVDNEQQAEINK